MAGTFQLVYRIIRSYLQGFVRKIDRLDVDVVQIGLLGDTDLDAHAFTRNYRSPIVQLPESSEACIGFSVHDDWNSVLIEAIGQDLRRGWQIESKGRPG